MLYMYNSYFQLRVHCSQVCSGQYVGGGEGSGGGGGEALGTRDANESPGLGSWFLSGNGLNGGSWEWWVVGVGEVGGGLAGLDAELGTIPQELGGGTAAEALGAQWSSLGDAILDGDGAVSTGGHWLTSSDVGLDWLLDLEGDVGLREGVVSGLIILLLSGEGNQGVLSGFVTGSLAVGDSDFEGSGSSGLGGCLCLDLGVDVVNLGFS